MIPALLFFLQFQLLTAVRVALIYPDANPAMNTQTAEMKCISEAVVKDFQSRGMKIDFKTFDNQREAARTLEVTREILKENYDLVMGTTGSAEALIAAETLQPANIPFVAPNASLASIVEGRRNAFLYTANDKLQSAQLARYIDKTHHPKRVVIIQNLSMPYSTFHTQEMQAHLKGLAHPPEISVEAFIDGEFSAPAMVEHIAQFQPDLIFTPIAGPHLAAIYNELKKSKIQKKVVVLGSDHIGGRLQFLKSLGGTEVRFPLFYISMWDGKINAAAKRDFDRVYQKYCADQTITMPMVSAFDTTRMLLEILKKKPGLRKEALSNELRHHQYQGAMGHVAYAGTQSPVRHYQLFEVRGEEKFWVKALN